MTQHLHLPPPVMKVVLGNELARLRSAAGVTQEEAAELLGCTQQKIAHVEAGSGIKLIELNALLDRYGAEGPDRSYARDLQSEGNRRTKRGAFSTRFRQYLRLLVDMEPSCDRYFSYQALVVPGLLQTEDYMRRNARAWRPSLPLAEIDEYAANRLARQRVLENPEQRFWFILDEAALRRTEGGPVMRAQVEHLVELIDRPNVEIQVVPFEVGFYMGQGHDYTIFGYDTRPAVDIIYVERHDGGEYIDNGKRAAGYQTLWDHQRAAASGPEQTRRLLLDLAASL
ncbi:transcriptional regulator, XRE family [Actinosynnema mirum DSM 43827]|uniref:Transcriptional regulator, XRE family n=1 Tax=Actinosynnema mirum (strain ATCC 29888 / DSM 43827 / JCM 3225 / NBRC 14064 / NCIMB 13271 / NRRL B-12336 / IMRU 3971 / 101) TaxID=446462 RepID=C6WBW6_ACTMD|nr:transcriptional regulator, XRE family [Actinosynnema mirum DSM 43827]